MSTVESTAGLMAEQSAAAAQAVNKLIEDTDGEFSEAEMDAAMSDASDATAAFHAMSHADSEQAKLDAAAGLAAPAPEADEAEGDLDLADLSGDGPDESAPDAPALEPMADPAAEAAAEPASDADGAEALEAEGTLDSSVAGSENLDN